MPDADLVIDCEGLTRRFPSGTALDDLAWYELFAGVRFGVILVRMSHRSIAFGQMEPPDDPDEHVMFVPLLERLIAEVKESTS